jgi:hypothetical protein
MKSGRVDDYRDGSQDDGNLQSAAGDFHFVVAVHFVVAQMLQPMGLLGELVHAVGARLRTHAGGVRLGIGNALLYLGIIWPRAGFAGAPPQRSTRFAGRLGLILGPGVAAAIWLMR